MGSNVSRIGDIGSGTCCVDTPHGTTGVLVTGAGTVFAEGSQVSRIGDVLVDNCHGVTGIMVTSSGTVNAEGAGVVRIGDYFTGCFSGTLVTGAGTVFAGG